MTPYRRFSTLPQMSLAVGVFAATALLLESGGLYDWAQRLDLGPERMVAVPVTTALYRALAPLRIAKERKRGLVALARIGWSDDPLAVEEATAPAQPAGVQPPASATAPDAVADGKTATPKAGNTAKASTPAVPLVPLAGAAPILSALPSIPPVAVAQTRSVALAGDSMMAVGLSSTILRQAPQAKDLTFLKAFKSGTGLARPEVFNWQLEYPAMLKNGKPNFVLVAIGANDGQGFVDGGVTYPFGTDGWQAIYQARVQAYIDMLEANGATVVWLGLPPMKSDSYNARIALINRIAYSVVSASPRAIWFSTAGLVGDANGSFRDFGEVNGKTTRLRQSDGIHMSDDGAVLVVSKLLPWLAAQVPAPIAPPASTTAPIAAAPAESPKP